MKDNMCALSSGSSKWDCFDAVIAGNAVDEDEVVLASFSRNVTHIFFK